jgi:hypothetical protein
MHIDIEVIKKDEQGSPLLFRSSAVYAHINGEKVMLSAGVVADNINNVIDKVQRIKDATMNEIYGIES